MSFDIRRSIVDEESGELLEEASVEYQDTLVELFAESPEGEAYRADGKQIGWAYTFLDYAIRYVGHTPPEMTSGDFDEVLFDLFPRKVSVEAKEAGDIIAELHAFWSFLGRAYELRNAPVILKKLDNNAAQRLERELSNPAKFGMAKSIVMQGIARGFDMTTNDGMDAWMHTYNAEVAMGQGRAYAPNLPDMSAYEPEQFSTGAPAPRGKKKSTEKNRRKMAKTSRKQNRRK